jgi:hypothetical protein
VLQVEPAAILRVHFHVLLETSTKYDDVHDLQSPS